MQKNIAKTIDHTLLAPDATREKIQNICAEANTYGFASVCVNSGYVADAKATLGESDVVICSVVGFPLGAMDTEAKAFEAKRAIENGAREIDMVINIGWLKSGLLERVKSDIEALRTATQGSILKVILETSMLSREEIVAVCEIARDAGADFVKTSTGFGGGGATVEDVRLMKATVGDGVQVKASGGVRDYATAVAMLEAGASRIGASAGIAIVTGAQDAQDNREGY